MELINCVEDDPDTKEDVEVIQILKKNRYLLH